MNAAGGAVDTSLGATPPMPVAAIDTPALVVDLDAMQRNISRMAEWAREHRIALRPHAKAHKSIAIARLQLDAGAVGVCVQKLGEAEALVAASGLDGSLPGLRDIAITNEIVDSGKLRRLAALALANPSLALSIVVDSGLGVDRLAAALKSAGCEGRVSVLVEVDIGQGRCGVAPIEAGALARQVVAHGLRFSGLQAYHGKAQHIRSAGERDAAARHGAQLARAAQAACTAAGVDCPLVTGGGTGTFAIDAAGGILNELQPGSYLFMDADYERNESTPGAPRFEQSLFVKSQVMSRGLSHAVVDAGHKAHGLDSGMPRVWKRGLEYRNGGDEHGLLMQPRGSADALPELGETIWLVPGHCDPTVNLHDRYVVVRGGLEQGVVDACWTVNSRGCLT